MTQEPAYAPNSDPYFDQQQATRISDDAAERAYLGAILTNPEIAADAVTLLTEADFEQPKNGIIWQTIEKAVAEAVLPDMVVIAARLKTDGLIRKIGGHIYLHDLVQSAPAASLQQTTYYASLIRNQARLRAIRTLGTKLRVVSENATPEELEQAYTDAYAALDKAYSNFGPTAEHIDRSWAPVDLEPVLGGQYLDPPPTILCRTDGTPLIYDGAVHTISGESESGKTWLTLHAATQLLAEQHRIVFIDFEDRADRVIARLLALGATPAQIRANFQYIRPDRPLDDNGRTWLTPHVSKARLVILDGVTEAMTMHGYDLNSNADSALFQNLLPRWIADHGAAVVMIDHVVKDKEKQDRFALGAQHKLAGIDGAAYTVKMQEPFGRGKCGIARVEVSKDRPGHVREHTKGRTIAEFTLDASIDGNILVATLKAPQTSLSGATETFEPTHLMEKISRFVQANPGVSKKGIETAINGKVTAVRLALELLVTRHYIEFKHGPRGAIQHFHQKAFYDPQTHPEMTDEDVPHLDTSDLVPTSSPHRPDDEGRPQKSTSSLVPTP